MKKSVVKPNDVCRIIKACKDTGVSEVNFGELHLVFGAARKAKPNPLVNGKAQPSESHVPQTPVERAEEIELGKELDEQDELDHLVVSNPAEYVRRLFEGDLENETT